MKLTTSIFVLVGTLLTATPALAASDVFIKFDGVDGESAVDSWSFGACNAGQCTTVTAPRDAASGKAGKPIKGNWDLATGKGARTTGGVNVAVGDLDGDGRADFGYSGTQDSVQALTLNFDKASPVLAKLCRGKHFDKVVLRVGAESYEITDAAGTCTANTDGTAARAIDQTPARISTNFTVGKQTQGATFGEKVQAGVAAAGSLTVTFTGGQMKHTKSGHVTLLK